MSNWSFYFDKKENKSENIIVKQLHVIIIAILCKVFQSQVSYNYLSQRFLGQSFFLFYL